MYEQKACDSTQRYNTIDETNNLLVSEGIEKTRIDVCRQCLTQSDEKADEAERIEFVMMTYMGNVMFHTSV